MGILCLRNSSSWKQTAASLGGIRALFISGDEIFFWIVCHSCFCIINTWREIWLLIEINLDCQSSRRTHLSELSLARMIMWWNLRKLLMFSKLTVIFHIRSDAELVTLILCESILCAAILDIRFRSLWDWFHFDLSEHLPRVWCSSWSHSRPCPPLPGQDYLQPLC